MIARHQSDRHLVRPSAHKRGSILTIRRSVVFLRDSTLTLIDEAWAMCDASREYTLAKARREHEQY